jgi:hypothetical protein
VDESWRVPHFEKMLYDQAQIVVALLEASQASGERFFADVAEDTLQYVMRQMTDAAGGFYSAEDADSIPPEHAGEADAHPAEGAFYLWTAGEIDTLLGADAAIVKRRFGIEANGNAPIDPQQEFVGKNLLYVATSIDQIARAEGKTHDEIESAIARARLRMFEERVKRPRPHLDDKVLTAWNGLMIGALARASRVVAGGASYLEAAQRAASFVRDRMWNADTRTLLRRYRRGEASIEGYAEDYAYLISGVLELFLADPDVRWLDWAHTLQRRQDELFWDEVDGGWFSTTGRDETVLLRMKEDYDGAEPTASAVSVFNLLTLSHLDSASGEPAWRERIEKTFKYFGSRLEQMGRAVPMMAAALATYDAGVGQVVLVSNGEVNPLAAVVKNSYLPFALTLNLTLDRQAALAARLPFVGAMHPVDGLPAAYVCREFTCRAPVTTEEGLRRELSGP